MVSETSSVCSASVSLVRIDRELGLKNAGGLRNGRQVGQVAIAVLVAVGHHIGDRLLGAWHARLLKVTLRLLHDRVVLLVLCLLLSREELAARSTGPLLGVQVTRLVEPWLPGLDQLVLGLHLGPGSTPLENAVVLLGVHVEWLLHDLGRKRHARIDGRLREHHLLLLLHGVCRRSTSHSIVRLVAIVSILVLVRIQGVEVASLVVVVCTGSERIVLHCVYLIGSLRLHNNDPGRIK
mmetsp:Transcript_8944/g.36927  ORF Transcript_8944/g.36927 Transcript_8944/m.36927 type:complete len:237 (-) Transcript_8944:3-713(-)